MEKWQNLMFIAVELGVHEMHGISVSSEKFNDECSPWKKREIYGNISGKYVRHI
jgi:hypothetical protein